MLIPEPCLPDKGSAGEVVNRDIACRHFTTFSFAGRSVLQFTHDDRASIEVAYHKLCGFVDTLPHAEAMSKA